MTMTLHVEAASVPEVLRVTRGAAGLSQRAIAPKIGVTHTTVAKWEKGEGEPSISQFIRWADATNQPAKQMLDGLIDVVRHKGLEPLTFWLGDADLELALLLACESSMHEIRREER